MGSENDRYEYENKICLKEGVSEIQNPEAALSTQTKAEDVWDIQEEDINNCPTYCNWNSSRAQSVILVVVVVMKFIVFHLLLGTQVTVYKSR